LPKLFVYGKGRSSSGLGRADQEEKGKRGKFKQQLRLFRPGHLFTKNTLIKKKIDKETKDGRME